MRLLTGHVGLVPIVLDVWKLGDWGDFTFAVSTEGRNTAAFHHGEIKPTKNKLLTFLMPRCPLTEDLAL